MKWYYKTLPVFFIIGAGIEWFMINIQIGKETFYDTVIRKESERRLKRTSAIGSMFMGASLVHAIYKPNLVVPEQPPSLETMESKLIAVKTRK